MHRMPAQSPSELSHGEPLTTTRESLFRSPKRLRSTEVRFVQHGGFRYEDCSGSACGRSLGFDSLGLGDRVCDEAGDFSLLHKPSAERFAACDRSERR
jgi:hypothetical protein